MRYIETYKQNPQKSFVDVMLGKILADIDNKLSDIKEKSIKEGNQNWKKSKLAIILLTMKSIVTKITQLRSDAKQYPKQAKTIANKIKQLMLQLKITTKLANNEMQVQKEHEKENLLQKQKQKVLTPFEERIFEQLYQKTR